MLARWRRLPRGDRALLVEAVATLTLASALIRLAPFRKVAGLASRRLFQEGRESLNADLALRVRWAVEAVAGRLPWRALCFQQGLAAHLMLRRRGQPSTLFYGVGRREGGRLVAHVWVRVGGRDVVGCEIADEFATVASFP